MAASGARRAAVDAMSVPPARVAPVRIPAGPVARVVARMSRRTGNPAGVKVIFTCCGRTLLKVAFTSAIGLVSASLQSQWLFEMVSAESDFHLSSPSAGGCRDLALIRSPSLTWRRSRERPRHTERKKLRSSQTDKQAVRKSESPGSFRPRLGLSSPRLVKVNLTSTRPVPTGASSTDRACHLLKVTFTKTTRSPYQPIFLS